MSSKIVSGKAAGQAVGMQWRPYHAPGSQPARAEQTQQAEILQARVRELENLVEAGAKEAYARGCREAGQEAIAHMEPAIQRFAAGVHELAATRPRARREAEEDVVMLAVAIAAGTLHEQLDALTIGLAKECEDRGTRYRVGVGRL